MLVHDLQPLVQTDELVLYRLREVVLIRKSGTQTADCDTPASRNKYGIDQIEEQLMSVKIDFHISRVEITVLNFL